MAKKVKPKKDKKGKAIKTDLDTCPFCGIKLSWMISDDIKFQNMLYYRCRNCNGEISINKNSSQSDNIFDLRNVFTVESVGGYNFSKSAMKENLSVAELKERAKMAQAEIEKFQIKKEKVTEGLIDKETGEIINTPSGVLKKAKRKRNLTTLILLLVTAALCVGFYLFITLS